MSEQRESKRTRARQGFTLIEVLLVVAILGILAAIVVVNFGGQGDKARKKATRSSIAAVCTAIDMYEVDTGRYPPSLKNLIENGGEPNWNGPYLRGGVPTDAWGTEMGYTLQGEKGYVVRSAGPDASLGNEDDLTSFTND